MVTTFAPNSVAFEAAPQATFPNPEIATVLPAKSSPFVFNILRTK